jgi:hypothetical protein
MSRAAPAAFPGRFVAQVAQGPDRQDAGSDAARSQSAPRNDVEAVAGRQGIQPTGRHATEGVVDRVPFLQEEWQFASADRRQRGRCGVFNRDPGEERPPGVHDACAQEILAPDVLAHDERDQHHQRSGERRDLGTAPRDRDDEFRTDVRVQRAPGSGRKGRPVRTSRLPS